MQTLDYSVALHVSEGLRSFLAVLRGYEKRLRPLFVEVHPAGEVRPGLVPLVGFCQGHPGALEMFGRARVPW